MKKEFIMLIGLPASGKSTYVKELLEIYGDSAVVVSRDDIVMKFAKKDGITYNESYYKYHKEIDEEYKKLMMNIRETKPTVVINDRTNLTTLSRDRTAQFFKDSKYRLIYVFFEKPKTSVQRYVWEMRLSGRKGKNIPLDTIKEMEDIYVDHVDENSRIFPDIIVRIDSWGK